MTKKLNKKTIIETLIEWKENIEIDISNNLLDGIETNNSIRQSTQLGMIIGLLSTLGKNNNIPE